MKRNPFWVVLSVLTVACSLLSMSPAPCQAARPLGAGDLFPQIPMAPMAHDAARAYLGIKKDQFFTLNDVRADMVLVEIMNTSCSSCRKQAAVYNELYSLIGAHPETRSKIKLMAIAVGNTDQEVQVFKDRFQVAFPMVGDPKYLFWDATGRTMTPLSLLVRQNPQGMAGVVAATHLGLQSRAASVFDELQQLLKQDPGVFTAAGLNGEKGGPAREPALIFSEQKIYELMVMSLFKAGIVTGSIQSVALSNSGVIYTGTGKRNGTPVKFFVKPVSRFLPCDSCHDAQFLYIFEGSGKILDIVPMQLSKYGNRPFTEKDLAKVRGRIVGRSLVDPIVFDPEVDAISGATITTSVLYKTLNEGNMLFEELKAAGLI